MSSSVALPYEPPTAKAPVVHIRRLAEHQVTSPAAPVPSGRPAPEPARRPSPPPPSAHALSQFLLAVLEIVDGRRSPHQLEDLLPVSEYRSLLPTTRTPNAERRRLRSLHPHRTAAGVLELCATVQHGPRARALVGRLELRGDTWQFTLLRWV